MEPLFEHRLSLAGYETRALELEGDGPPLLLLHGWADSADTWRILLDRLGRRDRRALAVDLPGFGRASRLGPGAILPQLDRFARAAVEYPVLLVWGRQDLLVFQTGAARVLEEVDDGALELIDDCGHCPQLERPDRFTGLLLDFSSQVARAA